jgi:hypothetical protein
MGASGIFDHDQASPDGGPARVIAKGILSSVEELIERAQSTTKPLELDPLRSQLFELFVAADEAGLIADDSQTSAVEEIDEEADEINLAADGLCRFLAHRWGLDMATREAQMLQTRLAPEQLEKMRLLWSVMRMWMEWTYAWRRWLEFHPDVVSQKGSNTKER